MVTTVPTGPGATVLIVEDRMVSNLVRAVLRKHGYEVVLADPDWAAELIRSPERQIDLLVTNQPGAFLPFADRLPLLYLTSAPDIILQTSFQTCRVVIKPFLPEELVEAAAVLTGSVLA